MRSDALVRIGNVGLRGLTLLSKFVLVFFFWQSFWNPNSSACMD